MSVSVTRLILSTAPEIPLTSAADTELHGLARLTRSPEIDRLNGATLLGERAALRQSRIPGRTSAGGGCALYDTIDGGVALSLARPDDRALLPALLGVEPEAIGDHASLSRLLRRCETTMLVSRGRSMGLAIADAEARADGTAAPAFCIASGQRRAPPGHRPPRVVDLTALWAGPLATHLLMLAGAEVIKVESRHRPDGMRDGDAAFFRLLNQGKSSVVLDLNDAADRAALVGLIDTADVVVESARPRALLQFGLDADAIVAKQPGLVWISITAHGATGAAANWAGFGDDAGVAAGLSAALREVSGSHGFVGDAIADPMTGIHAASVAWTAWRTGAGGRYDVALARVVAWCLEESRRADPRRLAIGLKKWADAEGHSFAPVARRRVDRPVANLGADTDRILRAPASC